MNQENDFTIYCSRCGAEMKSSSRYCMKCGNLNYDHPDNQQYRKMQPKEERQIYQVGSGHSLINHSSNESQTISVSLNTGNSKICFLTNSGLYLIFILISLFLSFQGTYTLEAILSSNFPIIAISISIFFLYFYSIQLLYVKSDQKWWYALIPIYNFMVLSDIVFHKKILGLLFLVPGINILFSLCLFYQLGKKFQYSGILTMLFPIIMVLFIGFGVHPYEGRNYVSLGEKNSLEKSYQHKKVPFVTAMVVFVVGCIMLVFADFDQFQKNMAFFGKGYYVYVARQLVKTTRKNIENGSISCEASYDAENGTYYFQYNDVQDGAFLLFYDFHDPMLANVMVRNVNGESEYYVELTDYNNGFPLTNVTSLTSDSVVSYTSLSNSLNGNLCKVTK